MRSIFVILISIMLVSCDSDFGAICGEDHDAVKLARSLSKSRLSELYIQMYELKENTEDPYIEYNEWDGHPIPEQFSDLNAVNIRPTSRIRPLITMAGCLDEYIYLEFYGAEEKNPRIELSWFSHKPEDKTKEVLWQKEG